VRRTWRVNVTSKDLKSLKVSVPRTSVMMCRSWRFASSRAGLPSKGKHCLALRRRCVPSWWRQDLLIHDFRHVQLVYYNFRKVEWNTAAAFSVASCRASIDFVRVLSLSDVTVISCALRRARRRFCHVARSETFDVLGPAEYGIFSASPLDLCVACFW
jgi:hypothetical protein